MMLLSWVNLSYYQFLMAGLRQAINEGIIPGPRMIVAGPAMVVTGSYAPKGFAPEWSVPQGADEADGLDGVVRVARNQIAHGVDLIKIYADYRWGPNGQTMPTFSEVELRAMVETARSSGRAVVAHSSTPEGMRRAIMAGVEDTSRGLGSILLLTGTKSPLKHNATRSQPFDSLRHRRPRGPNGVRLR